MDRTVIESSYREDKQFGFPIDIFDKLRIVDINENVENKVYKFDDEEDILSIISYFLELKNTNEPFYIVDINEINNKYQQWMDILPRITPYYAIKSNPDPMIIYILAKLDCGFDVASKQEIILAQSTNINSDKILYANPCKDNDSLQFARSQDVDYLTFDNSSELDKIKVYHPDAKCILRIKADDSKSLCKFGSRFGCTLEEAKDLLILAKLSGLNIVGVSFHVGSNCRESGQFKKAIYDARKVFDMGKDNGFDMWIVDIGGGYPGVDSDEAVTFKQLGDEINKALDDYFSDIKDLKIIAEPGRFFSTSSHTLVVTIIGIKEETIELLSEKEVINEMTKEKEIVKEIVKEKVYKYTINEGKYGSFNCIVFDNAVPKIYPYNERNEKTYKSVIYGCSCDLDIIMEDIQLPKMAIGDRLYVPNFGSYTRASSSSFNGFRTSLIHYIMRS